MKTEHYFVNLIDLPEVLPFTISGEGEDDLVESITGQEKSSKKLFEFVDHLEKKFVPIHYIGQDNIEGKFYQRFLFSSNGFLEIMQTAPAAVIAHFSDKTEAEKFSKALKNAVRKFAKDKKAAELLIGDIVVEEDTEENLTYQTWSKMKNIRKNF